MHGLISRIILVFVWNALLIPSVLLYMMTLLDSDIQITLGNIFVTFIIIKIVQGLFNLKVIIK